MNNNENPHNHSTSMH